MSAHVSSFPLEVPYNRDLSDVALWERSLRRSVHRREITEAARKHAARRKGAAVVVSASMAAGRRGRRWPRVARSGGDSARRRGGRGKPSRSAIALPSGALVSDGDIGEKVVAVQQQVGVDDDGIFGPITRGAVERFQARYGLPVTGEVDARTWQALFKSSVSFVGDGGKQVMTVYRPSGPEDASRRRRRTAARPPRRSRRRRSRRARRARVSTRGTTPAAKPLSTTPAPAPAPAAPEAAAPGGMSAPVSGTTTGVYGEARSGHSHAGKDIAAPTGTAVRAAQCGTVTQAGAVSRRLREPRLHPARRRRDHVLRPPQLGRDVQGLATSTSAT